MSSLPELEILGEAEFRWGQKGGVGGKNKKVQFYKSFTYDGVDYALYDCVYMYKEGEPAPYIGKLVKVWENVDKSKRVKIQWFFRPSEISYYLRDAEVLVNELFLASGEGIGLANLNPLEKNKWIKLPWEEKMKTAHDDGRLVMLHNLDPKYTSGEVEDIIWCVFKEKCTAKMVQHTVVSNPQSGQALVIFGSREAADRVLQKLDDECLMLPNQRPLVGCLGVLHNSSEKQTTFVGHLTIDKARRQIQREMKNAVATSHYSQNNTIEHEMAMDWCLLQSKSDVWWEKLYEQQREDITKLKGNLKPKKMKKCWLRAPGCRCTVCGEGNILPVRMCTSLVDDY